MELITQQCVLKTDVKFQPHMMRVINYLVDHRGIIVVHGTGSGKTLTSIGASQCLLSKFPDKQVLVVTPTSLVQNYKKEMEKYGITPPDAERYHFRTYGQMVNEYRDDENITTIRSPEVLCKDKILICDEAHNLKTQLVQSKEGLKGKLAAVMIKCAKYAFRVILLTATPVVNSKMDIVNLVAMVDGTDPMKKTEFERMLLNGIKLRQYLNNKVSFFSRISDDPNYPRIHEKDVFLMMDDDFYNAYHKIEMGEFKDMAASDLIKTKDVFAFLSGVRRAMNVADMEDSPKVNWVIDVVKSGYEHHQPGKTLVYSTWKKAGKDLIIRKLKTAGVKFTEVHGAMSKKNRNAAVNMFNNDKDTQVLLITKAGGEGLDLKNTKFVIVLDPMWNDANLQQVMGRAARYKSHSSLPEAQRDVYVYKLYLKKPPINWIFGVRKWNDKIASADILMCNFVKTKTAELKQFLTTIQACSIEANAQYEH